MPDRKPTLDYETAKPRGRSRLADVGCLLLWALLAMISLAYLNYHRSVEDVTIVMLVWVAAICVAVYFLQLTRGR